MPINPNPVLEAFMAGRQARNEKEARQVELTQRQAEEKQKHEEFQASLDELTRQHDAEINIKTAQNAREQAINEATLAQMQLQHENEIRAAYQQGGVTPTGGSAQLPTQSTPQEILGVSTNPNPVSMQTASIPTDLSGILPGHAQLKDAKGQIIDALTLTGAAEQQAKLLDITQAPLIARQAKAAQATAAAQATLDSQKAKEKQALDIELENLKLGNSSRHDEEAHKAKMDEIALEGANALAVAKVKGSSEYVQTETQNIINKYNMSDTFKNHTILSRINELAQSIPNDTKNPEDDTALVMQYARALDPEHTVRGDRFETVTKYAQTISQKFGVALNRIKADSSFLTGIARQNMKDTIKRLVDAQDKGYQLLQTDTKAQFKRLGVNPSEVLPSEFPPEHKKGDVVNIGGQQYKLSSDPDEKGNFNAFPPSYTAPNGKPYTFNSQEEWDTFKSKTGIK